MTTSNFYNQDDVVTLQRDLIQIALFEIDECLRKIGERNLLPAGEVMNMLLDVRQSLDRYYVAKVRRSDGDE